jgi:hypothetical protein
MRDAGLDCYIVDRNSILVEAPRDVSVDTSPPYTWTGQQWTEALRDAELVLSEAALLQVRVDSLCCVGPECAVGSYERLDLSARQLDPLIVQPVQGSERIAQEAEPIFLIGDQPTDDQLDGFLRHSFWRFWSASRQRFRRDRV